MTNTTSTTPAVVTDDRPKGSALAVSNGQAFWNATQLAALKQIGVQDASNGDLAVFLNFAQRTGLDPFAKQIYMIGRKSQGATKWTIQASIDGLRIVAERSGKYAGQVGPEYSGDDGVWRDTWTSKEPPVAARVGVLRHGFDVPLYAVAYYDEYVQTYNGQPSQMWREKPRLMLAKCAEALALRKAFPNDLSGIYTPDEMHMADSQTSAEPTLEGEIVEETTDRVTPAQLKGIATMLTKLNIKDTDQRHATINQIIGRDVESATELTKAEASQVLDELSNTIENSNTPVEDPEA